MTSRGITATGIAALLALGLLTGCTGDDGGAPEPGGDDQQSDGGQEENGGEDSGDTDGADGGSGDDSSGDDSSGGGDGGTAAPGEEIGGDGSACALPVTFTLPESWAPDRVELGADDDSSVVRRDGVGEVVCEVDAAPSGPVGYLRVWVGDASDASPHELAETFVDGELYPIDPEYREVEVDGVTAVEATYETGNSIDDETVEERALVVPAPDGVVVLELGGVETEDHRQMLPGYELAVETLRVD